MFWADALAGRIAGAFDGRGLLVIRDEKTASGRVHVGSLRGVAIHGLLAEVLAERGIASSFLYEINDFDPFDAVPAYLPAETFREHLGKPLFAVPSPDGKAKNYAEYFGEEFIGVIREVGFAPEFYRASELYRSGRMNEAIRIALENADVIRRIYREVSGSEKDAAWLPLSVVCERCGKIGTTVSLSFDGERVAYRCLPDAVSWSRGCGGEGSVSPFDGNAKLPWKVEWAAKFFVLSVAVEGGGKDHSTRGGARDVANRICREVYRREPPFDVPYEFFLVGGRKMSSSRGDGSSAREIADLLPPELVRFALIGKDISQAVNFEPGGESIPALFDAYDRAAEKAFRGERDDVARSFLLAQLPGRRAAVPRFLPRFSQAAFLVQMPHLDPEREAARMKGSPLTAEDREELAKRSASARAWLAAHAPASYRFSLARELPAAARALSETERAALREALDYLRRNPEADGEAIHAELHAIKARLGASPREIFRPLYIALLGREDGPKAGWFLSVLDRAFVLRRLAEAAG